MNLPNKLTLLRVVLTPIFMAALLIEFPLHHLLALVIFIAASLTDMLDGQIARKYNLVTDFGKFVDPLADKMLTTAAFIGFLSKGVGIGMEWILFIVLFREFAISSLRLVVVSGESKKVIPANIYGKAKTVSQMISIIFAIMVLSLNDFTDFGLKVPAIVFSSLEIITGILLWVSAVLAVISGIIYLKDGMKFVNSSK